MRRSQSNVGRLRGVSGRHVVGPPSKGRSHGAVQGHPHEDGVDVDVDLVARAPWIEAVAVPGLGQELLEGIDVQGAPAFA